MKKTILFTTILLLIVTKSFAQMESKNGFWASPKDTIRVFLVFAEVINDPLYNNAPSSNWLPGQMPNTINSWFDSEFINEQSIQSFNTKYFYQASMGKFIMLGDYYPNLIQIDYNDINNSYDGINEVYSYLTNLPGNDIITANGLSFNTDFDQWTQSNNVGLPRINNPDDNIDMIMVVWRVNSKLSHVDAGYVSGQYSSQNIKGINGFLIHSEFIKHTGSPRGGFRHEFSHTLLGGNNFHIGNGKGGRKNMFVQSGWSLLSDWTKRGEMCNAWDRRRLKWKQNESDYDIRAINPATNLQINADLVYNDPSQNTQEFILRDFVSTGDALRIKLPYLKTENPNAFDQYIWLENHQFKPGKIDLKPHNATKGIYAYLQIGKEALTGYQTFGEQNDYLVPLNAFGNYDMETGVDLLRTNYCTNCNTTYEAQWQDAVSTNGHVNINTNKLNPFTGGNIALQTPLNSIEPSNVGSNENPIWVSDIITRNEILVATATSIDGVPIPSTDCQYSTYTMFGTRYDAFTVGRKIGIGTNPPTTPRQTYETKSNDSYPFPTPRLYDNNKIYLNGLSIELLEEYPNGDIKVKISYDNFDIENNTRWCGDIVLNEEVNLLENKKITLDLGLYPTRPVNPINFNGEKIYNSPTIFTCNPNSKFTQNENSTVEVKKESTLHLKSNSTYQIKNGAKLIVKSGNTLKIDACARIEVDVLGEIILEDGATLEIEDGAILAFGNALQNI